MTTSARDWMSSWLEPLVPAKALLLMHWESTPANPDIRPDISACRNCSANWKQQGYRENIIKWWSSFKSFHLWFLMNSFWFPPLIRSKGICWNWWNTAVAKSPPSSVHSSCRKAGMKDWEAVPLPILSLTASYHLPIPCGLTGKYPCGKGKERSKAKSPYWEPRHRSWLPPSDDRLSITDPVALFREIGWLCHRRIFIWLPFADFYIPNIQISHPIHSFHSNRYHTGITNTSP